MSYCRLVEEVFEIQETVDRLKAKLRESENALQHLLRTKSSLEHDLNVKNNSLFIDRERCMGLRKTFPLAPRVACYWGVPLRMLPKLVSVTACTICGSFVCVFDYPFDVFLFVSWTVWGGTNWCRYVSAFRTNKDVFKFTLLQFTRNDLEFHRSILCI